MDNANLVGLVIKEAIDRIGYQEVEIKEECGTFQIRQAIFEKGELEPDGRIFMRGNFQRREWISFNSSFNTGRVVGKADKTERPGQMASHAAVQPIDIVRPVTREILHADNVDRLHSKVGSMGEKF
jgi:hypothetical protein